MTIAPTVLPLLHLQSSTTAPVCSISQWSWDGGKAVTAPGLIPEHLNRKMTGVSYCTCSNSRSTAVFHVPRHFLLPGSHKEIYGGEWGVIIFQGLQGTWRSGCRCINLHRDKMCMKLKSIPFHMDNLFSLVHLTFDFHGSFYWLQKGRTELK